MVRIKISKTLEQKIRRGYPWVFHYQVQNEKVEGKPGDLAVVYDSKNQFLAIGLYDPESDIRLRVLQTSNPVDIDSIFLKKGSTGLCNYAHICQVEGQLAIVLLMEKMMASQD